MKKTSLITAITLGAGITAFAGPISNNQNSIKGGGRFDGMLSRYVKVKPVEPKQTWKITKLDLLHCDFKKSPLPDIFCRKEALTVASNAVGKKENGIKQVPKDIWNCLPVPKDCLPTMNGRINNAVNCEAVPEPSALALTGLGLLGVAAWYRRNKK